jgi:hypothetical protein
MGNKNKNKNKIKIIIDKLRNVEYTFIDDGSLKLNTTSDNDLSKQSKRNEDVFDSIRRDKFKSTTNSLRFKSSKITKAKFKENHSPVYE